MKRITWIVLLLVMGMMTAMAQVKAEISFDKTSHDFGTFSEENPIVTCVFDFTNTGKRSLIIHQAIASCGCTVPEYTKTPIKPGEKGEIRVTYNGAGRYPGKFRKTITIHSNAQNDVVRLYIKGDMTPKDITMQEALEKSQPEEIKE